MILTLFIVLIAIALVIIWLGHLTDIPVYTLTGFAFMFLLSIILFNGSVTYATGDNTTYTYDVNATGPATAAKLTTYADFDDGTSRTIGFYLTVASILGFVVAVADLRSPRGMRA